MSSRLNARRGRVQLPLHVVLLFALLSTADVVVRADRGDFRGCYRLPTNSSLRNYGANAGQDVEGNTVTTPPPFDAQRFIDVDDCLDWCEDRYFRFAAPSSNNCSCHNNLTVLIEQRTAICDAPCPHRPALTCGSLDDPHDVSFYDSGLKLPGPVRKLNTDNVTNTTVTLRWEHTANTDLLGEYRISARIISSYANESLPLLPEWTVDAEATYFELLNMRPGTVYNLTVVSVANSSEGEPGGSRSVMAQTNIGWPQPEPAQPQMLGGTERTRVVQLPVPQNVMGPVTRVRIVVVYEDEQVMRRDFDASRLMGYGRAQEEGLNYYIAAELEPYTKSRRFPVGDGHTYQGYVNEPLPVGQHVHVLLGVVSEERGNVLVRYSESSHEQHDGVQVEVAAAKPAPMWTVRDEDYNTLVLVRALTIACGLFGALLVASVGVYVYLRVRMNRRLGMRRSSDQHELRLQPRGARSAENGAYEDDHMSAYSGDRLEYMLKSGLLEHQKIVRKSLKLDVNNVLGSGKFGDIITGTLMNAQVKVHVIPDDLEPLDNSHFLNDLDEVLRIQPHSNQLRFVGICQTPDWLYVIFEGTRCSLKKRLIDERAVQTPHRLTATSEEFVLRSLFNVAEALDFICNQTFRHKHLCAYNIAITVDDDVRLVTFGSQPFDEHGNRVDMSRWWAPEMLKHQNYTRRSDVWSFGCLMWECCSLGATLYATIGQRELYERIKAGDRPPANGLFLDDIYQLMMNCWQIDQNDRPTFRELADSLRDLLSSPRHVLSFDRRDGVVVPPHLPMLELESHETAATAAAQAAAAARASAVHGGGPRP